ncbi:unnamed protein product [Hapterophycus canaliculatus]
MSVTEEPKVATPKADDTPEKAPMAVAVNPENTEFSAGVLGGVAGFFVGGPVLAAVLAVAANYGSKQQNEAGEAVRGVSANAIEAFNFLTNINSKYNVTGKAGEQLDKAVSELKSSGEAGEAIEKVEKTVKGITSQATKLSSDYDLPAKAKQALGVAGELADTAIVKGIELEKEYKVTEKVTTSIKKTIDSAKN